MSSEDITILQKSLFSYPFLWVSSLFFAAKEWRQFKQNNSLWCFHVIPLNNADDVFAAK